MPDTTPAEAGGQRTELRAAVHPEQRPTMDEYARQLGLQIDERTRTVLSHVYWDGFGQGRAEGLAEIREFIDEVR